MKIKNRSSNTSKRTILQLVIALLLLILPLAMIIFNGNRALQGIIWRKINEPQSSILKDQSNEYLKSHQSAQSPEFGIFDPANIFKDNRTLNYEQIYFNWTESNGKTLQLKLEQIILNKRVPVFTIEPWNGPNDEHDLLTDISKGKYDQNIDRIIKVLSGCSGRLYISWGHEMDQNLTKRYPWSGRDPDQYIQAYRYVQDRIRKVVKNEIRWIWSPVVKNGCERYWPGSDYVDFVGLPIYSYPAWDKSWYGHIRSFKSWYTEKYNLVRQFQKPLIIVELGVTGSADYQTFWLQEAFEYLKNSASVEIVLFFYTKDTEGSWGKDVSTPDWRTDPQIISGLVKWIKE